MKERDDQEALFEELRWRADRVPAIDAATARRVGQRRRSRAAAGAVGAVGAVAVIAAVAVAGVVVSSDDSPVAVVVTPGTSPGSSVPGEDPEMVPSVAPARECDTLWDLDPSGEAEAVAWTEDEAVKELWSQLDELDAQHDEILAVFGDADQRRLVVVVDHATEPPGALTELAAGDGAIASVSVIASCQPSAVLVDTLNAITTFLATANLADADGVSATIDYRLGRVVVSGPPATLDRLFGTPGVSGVIDIDPGLLERRPVEVSENFGG